MSVNKYMAWADLEEHADIVLLSPPFIFPPKPSVALSIFRCCLDQAGLSSKVIYPMFLLSHIIGEKEIRRIESYPDLLGLDEFLFAHLTDVLNEYTVDDFINGLLPETVEQPYREELRELIRIGRKGAEICVDITARKIVKMGARVLAGSSVFSQQNGTLAIFKRVKQLDPSITTLMGGTNVAGAAGAAILRHYQSVDYVFFGEGDEVFAETCQALLDGADVLPYGVVSLKTLDEKNIPHRMTRDMNTVCNPDYCDFIEEWKRELAGFYGPSMLGENYNKELKDALYLEGVRYAILIEGSRGCWWGQKNKCTFCGLNGMKNVYRTKACEKLHEDIKEMAEKNPGEFIQLTDNILSMDVINKLLPALIEDKADYSLVGEVKTNITENEIRNLKQAGFCMVQPGIESLNDHLLQLMGKGNTGINHVAFLKYCRTHGPLVYWNMLYGAPGEEAKDYEELVELIPKIVHYQPPVRTSEIIFQNFSGYYDSPEAYGLELTPAAMYRYCYGNDADRIKHMAFYYDLTGGWFKEVREAHRPLYRKLMDAVYSWKILSERNGFFGLMMSENAGGLFLVDTRTCARLPFHFLEGAAADIYRLAWAPISYDKLLRSLPQYTEGEIKKELESLEENNLILSQSGKYLALALPKSAI